MPNRILRDCTDSFPVNTLSSDAERFFYRLIMKVDDFGRFTAEPVLLRPCMYPLQLPRVSEDDISTWTGECVRAGLVVLYEASGKRYLQIENFKQRTRATHSKYPGPDEHDGHAPVTCPPHDGRTTDNSLKTNDRHMTVTRPSHDGLMLTETETETETETKDEGAPRRGGDTHNGKITNSQAEAIYGLYPRKVGKQAAIKAIKSAHAKLVKAGHDDPISFLTKQVAAYAASPAGRQPAGDDDYRPHPATWFNQGRYEDDPAEWVKRNGGGPSQPKQPDELGGRLGTRELTPAEAVEALRSIGVVD